MGDLDGFLVFEQSRMMRGVQVPPNARLHPVALIENEEAIQASLMEVINAIARNTIDLRRADLMLKALHIAVKNAHRVRFDSVGGRTGPPGPRLPAPANAGPHHARNNGQGGRDRNRSSGSDRIRQ